MSLIIESIQVSILAMGVIFLVLGILIGVIRALVHFLPYSAPPAPASRARAPVAPASATGAVPEEDHVAAIHAALAHHLGKVPQDLHIVNITDY